MDIDKFLKPNGIVLIQENGRATRAEDFTGLVEKNGLEVVDIFKAKPISLFECIFKRQKLSRAFKPSPFYFMWSKLK